MQSLSKTIPPQRSSLAWACFGLVGVIALAWATISLADNPSPHDAARGLAVVWALGLMGAGMIGAAVAIRFVWGCAMSLIAAAGFVGLAWGQGSFSAPISLALVLAFIASSMSFAARGALFARSNPVRGWWIAIGVVTGEAAIIMTALSVPEALPNWLLALLPAQWAYLSIHAALLGESVWSASAALIALIGTAGATLLVKELWPKRWPYALMFSVWISLSALVWQQALPMSS